MKIVSGPYSNLKYGFDSPAGLWKVVARVPVFVIALVAINELIGLKAVPQVWYFFVDFWKFIYKHHRRFFLLLVDRFINITEYCYFG